jgi:hypothetical protein
MGIMYIADLLRRCLITSTPLVPGSDRSMIARSGIGTQRSVIDDADQVAGSCQNFFDGFAHDVVVFDVDNPCQSNLQAAPQFCCCTFRVDSIRQRPTATSEPAIVPPGTGELVGQRTYADARPVTSR